MKSRRTLLRALLPLSIAASESNAAETAESKPNDPELQTFPSHGIELALLFNAVGNPVVVLKNNGEADVKFWAPQRGPGEYAYRFEIRNPAGFHFIILPRAKNRDYNPMELITVKTGDRYEFKVNLQDGEWKIPKNLPSPLVKCQMRAWYKPLNFAFEKKEAAGLGVTLDTFVGDWADVPSWPGLTEGKDSR